jgi:D-serine deaminase-like pyridoxal phosphate-dependent protein
MAEPWYCINDNNEIDSPALVIYKHRVQHNLKLAIQMVGDASRLRPHVKTHKSPELTKLMLQAGITKFKCATIAEAEMLAQCNAADVLLAYQPAGPKIARLLKLIQAYPLTHFSCLVDSAHAAQAIAAEAMSCRLTLNILLDVNVGMNRTGVLPQNTAELFEACRKLQGISVVGLHGYDGYITDGDVTIRRQRADEAYNVLEQVQKLVKSTGLEQPVIVVGGSPTFGIHAQRENVECSPGTFIYWDRSYEELFPDLPFLPAVLVMSRVISIVNEKRICLDLGHKSVAAENPLDRRIFFLNAEELHVVGQSEEHLVAETDTPHHYKVGDVLYGMPFHVCPTCALYHEAYVIDDGRVKEVWKMVARDRKILI